MRQAAIELGTAVRLAVSVRGDPAMLRTLEGVVIEVVPAGRAPELLGTALYAPSRAARYVVQCDGWRVLLRACDLVVVAP